MPYTEEEMKNMELLDLSGLPLEGAIAVKMFYDYQLAMEEKERRAKEQSGKASE